MKYHCEYCGYEGHCYGTPTSQGVSAPWCRHCARNGGLIPLHEWQWFMAEERMLGLRQKRRRRLFIVSVIIAAVCAAVLYIGIVAYAYEEAITPAPPAPRFERIERPQLCAEFRRKPDPRTWDPETEEYPTNLEWRECMGVG